MSTDRSQEPFPSLEEAAKAVQSDPRTGDVGHRLLATLLLAEQRTERARLRAERAEAEASTDALTGVFNRRQWERLLEAEERRCARYGHPACIVAVDLDALKTTNDSAGHQAGDALLRAAASALAGASRATDFVARVGGDEFAVMAVDTDLATGRVLADRLGEALAAADVRASLGLAARAGPVGRVVRGRPADVCVQAPAKGRRGG